MSLITLLAAFGGGVFGSVIGGTVAFVFTGLTALIGIAIMLSTGDSTFLDTVAFGPFFGPHVAFVGAVAASAVSGLKRKKLEGTKEVDNYVEGADAASPLFFQKDPVVILVGGIFGVLGFLVQHFYASTGLGIDTVALTVATMGIITRLVITRTGITGKYPEGEKKFDLVKKNTIFTLLMGFAAAAVTSYAVVTLGVDNIGFAISAFSLIFLYTNVKDFPVTHHITMVAGFFAITTGNVLVGAIAGALAALLGEYVNAWTNTHVESHIDMPAVVIAIGSFIALTLI